MTGMGESLSWKMSGPLNTGLAAVPKVAAAARLRWMRRRSPYTASFRSSRGFTLIAALCDETAFWRSDETSANPDSEIINALRPAMATIPNSMLLAASSPYARKGELWNAYHRYHGRDDAPALVWHAPTKVMNPTVPQSIID